MKQYLLKLFIIFCLFAPTQPVAAQTYQNQLIDELNRLLERLQEIKQSQVTAATAYSSQSLMPSQYYDGPYEAIYFTEGPILRPYGNTIFEATDAEFWNLWRTVVGEYNAAEYFTEMRLYNDNDALYDGFVERLEGDDWILGVNVAGIDITDKLDRETTIELFVHEYAHVLHYYNPEIAAAFSERFWSVESPDEDDYVSRYAMQSAEEDFAETFMHYVLYPETIVRGVARQKVAFFSRYTNFVDIRANIQRRLQ